MATPYARPPDAMHAGPVVLRRNRPEDAEDIAVAVAQSLEHLRPWMPWATADAATPEAQRQRIEDGATRWAEGTDLPYVVRTVAGGAVVGVVGLHRRVGEGGIEIGYWTHVDHVGRGYCTAAVRALTAAALALPDVSRVEIHCDEANRASAAVPRKLGYRLDRIEDDEVSAPGEIGRSMIWITEATVGDSAVQMAGTRRTTPAEGR